MCSSILVGVLSSLVAAAVFWFLSALAAERIRRSRAKPFIGRYRMFTSDGSTPTLGTVRIERKNWIENLLSSAPILTVFAEHGGGKAPGTEDWTATVEVLGLSKTASGYYSYPNREGGALRFTLSEGAAEITEYGIPFDRQSQPFVLVLKREMKSH
jgi:hypothetical protein